MCFIYDNVTWLLSALCHKVTNKDTFSLKKKSFKELHYVIKCNQINKLPASKDVCESTKTNTAPFATYLRKKMIYGKKCAI